MIRELNNVVKVFPAYAGVILSLNKNLTILRSIPRVCGGDPDEYG